MAEQGLASELRVLDSLKDIFPPGDGVTEKDIKAGLYWPGVSGIPGIIPGEAAFARPSLPQTACPPVLRSSTM